MCIRDSLITEETRADIEKIAGVQQASLYTKRTSADQAYYQNTAFTEMCIRDRNIWVKFFTGSPVIRKPVSFQCP